MAVGPHVYIPSAHDDRLRQGEVLSDLVEWNIVFNDQGEAEADHVDHPFAVIVTQDCDLEQDYRARTDPEMKPQQRENGLLAHVLVVVAANFEASKEKFAGSDVRRRAHQNKDERYQFLAPGGPTEDLLGLGFPSLILDSSAPSRCRSSNFSVPYCRGRRNAVASSSHPTSNTSACGSATSFSASPFTGITTTSFPLKLLLSNERLPSLYATRWSNHLGIEISLSD